jgi:hypothetical protein
MIRVSLSSKIDIKSQGRKNNLKNLGILAWLKGHVFKGE